MCIITVSTTFPQPLQGEDRGSALPGISGSVPIVFWFAPLLPFLVEGSTVRTVYLAGGDAVSSLCSKQIVSGPGIAFVSKVSYLEAFSQQFSQPSLEAAVEENNVG